MRLLDGLASGQVGDGPRHLEDAGVGADGESEAVGDHLEPLLALLVDGAEAADVPRLHLGIGVQAEGAQAAELEFAGAVDAVADRPACFSVARIGELLVADAGDLDVQVDAVEQRSGEARALALDHRRGAGAVVLRVAEVAAGAGLWTPLPRIASR